jgi:hypothetical protein
MGRKARTVALSVLDLTAYTVGNTLMRGCAAAVSEQVATVLDEMLAKVCPRFGPIQATFAARPSWAAQHDLTLYAA